MNEDTQLAKSQAQAQLDNVVDMVAALECDFMRLDELQAVTANGENLEEGEFQELQELLSEANGCADEDKALEAIEQDALSVDVRNGWHIPGDESEPTEYRIVLCTGGPHVEIRGDISQHGEPESAELYYQDWFTGLQRLPTNSAEQDALLKYAGCFIAS